MLITYEQKLDVQQFAAFHASGNHKRNCIIRAQRVLEDYEQSRGVLELTVKGPRSRRPWLVEETPLEGLRREDLFGRRGLRRERAARSHWIRRPARPLERPLEAPCMGYASSRIETEAVDASRGHDSCLL